jgi:hypothetical protein
MKNDYTLHSKTAMALPAVSTESFSKPNLEGFLYALPMKLRNGPAFQPFITLAKDETLSRNMVKLKAVITHHL